MSTPKTQTCPLLRLPQELRDKVYTYYLTEDEGYHHNPEMNKLRYSDERQIVFAFMYTCKQIYEEMKELPLKVNSVTFTTFFPIERPGMPRIADFNRH
ncbi:hypothetical protein EJ02DRAFT_231813 [Clathrospora elynae]|uniref:F-box domain-containing protein n=1 Tax=Clathrospora elynae TaxID=706981 RepID=A0A6A5SKU7_9PLEO|nr:hypothetical protein EJ02DRAFT_231813 [Clathrospora elynae]